MPDFEDIIIFLLIFGFIFFQIITFIDNKKKEKEFRVNNEELTHIRDLETSKPFPNHMNVALDDFIQDYRANGNIRWNDFSPLVCFGYRVGKAKGKPEHIRREIIYFTWYAEIPDIIPRFYAEKWGKPGTFKRFDKIHSHLVMLGKQRANRKGFEVAVDQWHGDAGWFYKNYSGLAHRYNKFGYSE
ncbi:hypothetical protein PO25_17255 [Vibrio anguillarum]|uniref:hypothetical protein n=1 Tax=Vibrio TaxID=662 RepID=UPI00097E2C29|nr:hypothetical protein [Vibrio anguillarum]MBT2949623.1 hypothetical protein [Vibrio anguillarum]